MTKYTRVTVTVREDQTETIRDHPELNFSGAVQKMIDEMYPPLDLSRLTDRDIRGMVEIAISRNVGDFNSTMLDDSPNDVRDYLRELDPKTLDQIYREYI